MSSESPSAVEAFGPTKQHPDDLCNSSGGLHVQFLVIGAQHRSSARCEAEKLPSGNVTEMIQSLVTSAPYSYTVADLAGMRSQPPSRRRARREAVKLPIGEPTEDTPPAANLEKVVLTKVHSPLFHRPYVHM